jgi:multidrug resistance efflux pump
MGKYLNSALLLLVLSTGTLLPACKTGDVQTEKATITPLRQDFVHSLKAEGVLEPVVQETLTVPERMAGTLEMLLPEGTQVKKGQTVAKINSRSFLERMSRYTERSTEERANLMKQRAEMPLERLKIQAGIRDKQRAGRLSQLEKDLIREGPRLDERVKVQMEEEIAALKAEQYPLQEKEELYNKGYLPEQELLAARQELLALETTRDTASLTQTQQGNTYRQPEIQAAELKTRSAGLETRIAELEGKARQSLLRTQTRNQGSRVQGFERRFNTMQSRLNGTDLRAPFDGTVLYPRLFGDQVPKVGMDVWNGLPVVQVARTSQLRVRARIDEFRIPHLKVGQMVKLSSPGLPGEFFNGKVTKIEKLAKYKDESKPVGLKYFEIEIEPEKIPPALKAQMRVDLEIAIETLKQVWTVPLETLQESNQTSRLRIREGNQIRSLEVKVLARSENRAAIQADLSGKEAILLGESPL